MVAVTAPKVRAPAGLGKAGKALWSSLVAAYEFAPHEVVLVERACRLADREAQLQEVIARDGLVVDGSNGQPRLNGAVAEARLTTLAISRVLGSLKMPDESGRPLSAASVRSQRAANSRWDRQRDLRARQEGA